MSNVHVVIEQGVSGGVDVDVEGAGECFAESDVGGWDDDRCEAVADAAEDGNGTNDDDVVVGLSGDGLD